MQKFTVVIAALLVFLGVGIARADNWETYEGVQSSFSDVATPGPVMVSSTPVRFLGVTYSSPAGVSGGQIVIYRSTEPTFTNAIATQTAVGCNWANTGAPPGPQSLYGVVNTSYTYVQRIGNCAATIWFTFPEPIPLANEGRTEGFGLPITGRRDRNKMP